MLHFTGVLDQFFKAKPAGRHLQKCASVTPELMTKGIL